MGVSCARSGPYWKKAVSLQRLMLLEATVNSFIAHETRLTIIPHDRAVASSGRETLWNSCSKLLELSVQCWLICPNIVLPAVSSAQRPDIARSSQLRGATLMRTEILTESSEVSVLEDHELLGVVRSRNQHCDAAAEILTERLGGFLISIICTVSRLQPDDLADVVQQVWIRAFSPGDESFQTAAEFRAWLKSVARTRTIDSLRRRPHTSIPENLDPDAATHRENPEVLALGVCVEELEAAKPDFACVVRGICAGKSGQQLSVELGISQNTVYSRFDRSKTLLRECVERRLA